MTYEEATQIIQEVADLEGNQRFQKFVAQAHSRSILQSLQAAPETWPKYTLSDEDLHYTAHYLFWQGLQLKSVPEYRERGDWYIKLGCEILEFLYVSLPPGHPDRTDQLFNAALGYYISGYYARAYVLMRDLQTQAELPQEIELLRRLFEKDFVGMRQLISAVLEAEAFSDEMIATGLRDGALSQDDALDRIFHASLNRAFSYFIEYPKTGHRSLFDRARELIDHGIQLALRTGFVDWWWLFYCTRYLFDEYDANAFWTVLSPMGGDDPDKRFVEPYIRTNYIRRIPVIELWRSQTAALPYINEPARGSYCLKMPTSAGKTRIAELAILRFLLDHREDPTAKCVYVAPFRSLAVEIENSFRESFHPLGVRVSELYGGFELGPIERLLMEETRIIVATPEKIDAFLRYNPEFAKQTRLIVIDEGHIISLSDRGIRYEFFLHRLVRRFAQKDVRVFFLSAVLPNTDEFAQWITGDPDNVITKEWRPSRLLIGELRWNGESARIDYFEADHKPLGHECFVPSFILPIDPRGLPGVRYRRSFPHDIGEVVAEAGVRFAQQGTTMIFCARKVSVEPMAESVIRSLRVHTALAEQDGTEFALPVDEGADEALQECIRVAEEHMGRDNKVAEYLRAGFVIHHADIPKPVRIRLEQLVRSGAIRLIVATTTLAHGVNFPIQTVIVHGLSHGYDQQLTPIMFWNICGRAGRGMHENEGQVLFAVDLDLPNVRLNDTTGLTAIQIQQRTRFKRQKRIERETLLRKDIIEGYHTYRLLSSLRELLFLIVQNWKEVHGGVDVAELCTRLAENDLGWLSSRWRKDVGRWLDVLDTELLALIEELGHNVVSPDVIQRVMEVSLLFLQAMTVEDAEAATAWLREMLFARWQYVSSIIQANDDRRRRFYKLGFPLRDCRAIEDNAAQLLTLLLRASDFEHWSAAERCAYLVQLAEFLLSNVAELKPDDNPTHGCWEQVLRLWLCGNSPNEIAADDDVSKCTRSPTEVSTYIEDAFVYKLPWGLNALIAYLADMVEDTIVDLPPVASYFPALVKYGVHDPVASCLLAFGLESRKLALKLAAVYPGETTEAGSVLMWFLELSKDELTSVGLSKQETRIVSVAQESAWSLKQSTPAQPQVDRLEVLTDRSDAVIRLAPGDMLTLRVHPDVSPRAYSLSTLWGARIGLYEHYESTSPQWVNSDRVSMRVTNVEQADNGQIRLQVEVAVL
jgi:replicative superfamily II helicase